MSHGALEIPVRALTEFSADRRVYRVFNHLLVVSSTGELLAVPMALVTGDLREVVDRSPVDWLEVIAVLDAEAEAANDVADDELARGFALLATISGYGWKRDRVGLTPNGTRNIERVVHASGIRYARVSK